MSNPGKPDFGVPVTMVYSADEIDAIIARMADAIAADLGSRNPIVIPILMGGAFTAMKLVSHFDFSYEMDSVRAARYGPGRFGGKLHWYAQPCLDLNGRDVLVVDDVLERGITLTAVEHELRRLNAGSVSAAVLIRKELDPSIGRPGVDYVGADAPDRFLFGCGMDLDGLWRGLTALYAVESEDSGSTL